MSDKSTIRDEARKHRARINIREDNPEDAVRYFFNNIELKQGDIIAFYWPVGREFDPRPILDECLQRGYICALPVVEENTRILKFVPVAGDVPLVKGVYGIMGPAIDQNTVYVDPDIVLVPMLAFDQRGTRLGQGGGYYDATLRDLRGRKTVTAVGVAYGGQACLFNLPREDHDEKLDWIVTPQGAKRF